MLEEFVPVHIPKSISSERLTLRQYRVQDWEEYHELYSSSFAGHLEPWSPVPLLDVSEAEARRLARQHIMAALEKWEDGDDYRFFIVLRATGRIVGQLGITQITRNVSQSCAIGYWIGKEHLNRGYATEALGLGMQFAFEFLKLHRITLWISPKNSASLRIADKLKLRFEGVAVKALFLGGYWQDTKIFAMTSEEWSEQREQVIKRSLQHTPNDDHQTTN